MKPNFFKFISYFFFGVLFINAGQVFGQAYPSKTVGKSVGGDVAKPQTDLKGEYTKDGECVDLIVKKGCVNYTVGVTGGKIADRSASVKVCADVKTVKPVNICRKGAKRITVNYEKLDAGTDIEFKTSNPGNGPKKNNVKAQ